MDTEIELADQGDKIIRTKDFEFEPNPKGLAYDLYINLRKYGDKIAQKDAETEETDTYKDYAERIVRVALHLRKRGIKPEDVVTPCTSVNMNSNVTFIATILSGAIVACVDPKTAYVDGKSQIELIKPKIIFVSLDSIDMIAKIVEELGLKTELVVFGETDKYTPFSVFLEPLPKEEEENFEPYIPKSLPETAIILFSSGSTGVAKGICCSYYAVMCQIQRLRLANLIGTHTCLFYSSLGWGTSHVIVIGSILTGIHNLLCRDFEVEKTWRYLVKYEVGHILLKPHNCVDILSQNSKEKIDAEHLKMIIMVGGKLFQESADAISKIFTNPVPIVHTYGQTEVYGTALTPKPKHIRNVNYIGSPAKGFWYKVIDPETDKICGPNEQGELCIKSKFVMTGYYNQDSSDRFDKDGYLKSGDMVYYDEEHNFFFVERFKEALKYKSYWLSPTYLESILSQHRAVKIACVIGIPIEDGDLPTAIVVKENNFKDVTGEELIEYVNEQVTDLQKIRGGVIFVEESLFEYTHSGKLKRQVLRRKVLEQLG